MATADHNHFHFVVPVWGQTYSQLFVETCLPMLLTPGNLLMCEGRAEDEFVIATTWHDWECMQQSASIKRLQQIMKVAPILIDGHIDIASSHSAMSACYGLAMKKPNVIADQTNFVFLTPDSFWSEGTFARLAELAGQNYKMVMVAGLRVNAESVAARLRAWIASHPDNPAMTQAELVEMVIDNLHQLSKAHNFVSGDKFLNIWPSHIYWIDDQEKKMVAHCFHMHPLMMAAPKRIPAIHDTIDGAFLDALRYPLKQYYIVQGELLGVELSPIERSWGQPLGAPSMKDIKHFARTCANSRHWHFFSKRIIIDGKPDQPFSPLLMNLCERVVQEILDSKPKTMLAYRFRQLHNRPLMRKIAKPFRRICQKIRRFGI